MIMSDLNLPEEEIESARYLNVIYETDQIQLALKRINKVMKSSMTKNPRGLCIVGDPGVGKTTIMEQFQKQHPRIITDEVTIIPVVSITTPGKLSTDALYAEILSELKDPEPTKGTIPNKEKRVLTLIEKCQVKLILIDEYHQMIPLKGPSESSQCFIVVKDLMIKKRVSVALFGIPSVHHLTEIHPQLGSRFNSTITIPKLSLQNAETTKNYLRILAAMTKNCPIDISIINSKKGALSMLVASEGYFRAITSIIQDLLLENPDLEKATYGHFRDSWIETASPENRKRFNTSPFEMTVNRLEKLALEVR